MRCPQVELSSVERAAGSAVFAWTNQGNESGGSGGVISAATGTDTAMTTAIYGPAPDVGSKKEFFERLRVEVILRTECGQRSTPFVRGVEKQVRSIQFFVVLSIQFETCRIYCYACILEKDWIFDCIFDCIFKVW